MPIVVVTPAESSDLTTTNIVKEELGIGVATYDSMLSRMIKQVSAAVVRHCGKVFARERVKETIRGNDTFSLMVSRTPVIEVHAIKLDGDLIDASEYLLSDPDSGFIHSDYGWRDTTIHKVGMTRYPSESGKYSYEVEYTAGWVLPSFTTGTRDLPYDIEAAAVAWVKAMFTRRDRSGLIKSESVEDVFDTEYDLGAMPQEVRDLLRGYVRYV